MINFNFRDTQRDLILELELALEQEMHETYTIRSKNTPRFLVVHNINTANNKIKESFTTLKITKLTEIISKIMYNNSALNSVSSIYTLCKQLSNYI